MLRHSQNLQLPGAGIIRSAATLRSAFTFSNSSYSSLIRTFASTTVQERDVVFTNNSGRNFAKVTTEFSSQVVYWEILVLTNTEDGSLLRTLILGIADRGFTLAGAPGVSTGAQHFGSLATYINYAGRFSSSVTTVRDYGGAAPAGTVYGILYNGGTGQFRYFRNGVDAGLAATMPLITYTPIIAGGLGTSVRIAFDRTQMNYPVPGGAVTLSEIR